MSDTSPSFEVDVKPMFRDSDRASMATFFDLWSASDVAENGRLIATRLGEGTMPCDGPWPAEHVAIFTRWLDGGAQP